MPFRICFRADLYPREYFPDLTTRARREEMDSEDLVAFDFLVGAMTVEFFCFLAKLGERALEVVWAGGGIDPSVDRGKRLYSSSEISAMRSEPPLTRPLRAWNTRDQVAGCTIAYTGNVKPRLALRILRGLIMHLCCSRDVCSGVLRTNSSRPLRRRVSTRRLRLSSGFSEGSFSSVLSHCFRLASYSSGTLVIRGQRNHRGCVSLHQGSPCGV